MSTFVIHSSSAVASAAPLNARPNDTRPVASFHPSPWGEHFLNYVTADEVTQVKMEKKAKELEDEVKKELKQLQERADKMLDLIKFIDAIERLGIAYRLQEDTEQAMQIVHKQREADKDKLDLFHTSLCFRLLRQHGLYISCEVFSKFQDEEGRFKDSLASDVKGMLSLYEASFVGRLGDDYMMDEARAFTTAHLRSVAADSNHPLESQVSHALYQPLHRGMPRLESWFFISFYEEDPSHNKTLLKFAKLDFNIVQALHKKELRDLTMWWKDLNLFAMMQFTSRDRLVESYFWTLGLYYEPEYSMGRKIFLQTFKMVTLVDDIYDAYGTIEELKIFTKALERWDRSSMSELPKYMQLCYKALLDTFEEFEHDLAPLGKSQFVKYAREELIEMVRAYFQEANWRNKKHTPTYDEYMNKASAVTSGNYLSAVLCNLAIKESNKEAFDWVHQKPLFIRAGAINTRLVNDLSGHTFDKERNHVPSAVETYMRQYEVTEEEARTELLKKVDYCWKVTNEMMMKPHIMPKPLLRLILNQNRIVDVIYKKGEDSFTCPGHTMKNNISLILTDPIPII